MSLAKTTVSKKKHKRLRRITKTVTTHASRGKVAPAAHSLPVTESSSPVKKKPVSELRQKPSEPSAIIGIGASAGGLEAFSELLRELPNATGMTLVFVQHLDPNYKSLLAELLGRTTHIPVTEVRNGMRIEPNHVYVIPPGTNMRMVDGILTLTPRQRVDGKHMPIDTFLESLAENQKNLAVGILLSGTSVDGIQGLRAIKAEGGITIAQDEKTAKFYDLPRAAIDAGVVDLVLSPKDIARELANLPVHRFPTLFDSEKIEEVLPESDLGKIFSLLRSSTGVDFTEYKQSTIKRRILRRMLIHKITQMDDYLKYLEANPKERNELFQDMLINVTGFFREPSTFDALKTEVFPNILKGKKLDDTVRIWIPGCSTGEEAYSVAICLTEYLENKSIKPHVQIFATDINDSLLTRAREGVYSPTATLSPERLRRFFTKSNGNYLITKPIRRMVVFAKQNITADPPFSRIDLIVCRNVLIYLGPNLQKRLFPIFHYALRPNGYLVLGDYESIGSFTDLFRPVSKKYKIYGKRPVETFPPADFPVRYDQGIGHTERSEAERLAETLSSDPGMAKEADRILLAKYSPAAVIVSNDLDIIQFRGRTGLFLEPAPGKASLNILKMAREGLMLDLRQAIEKARKSEKPVKKSDIVVRSEDGYIRTDIEVTPLRSRTKQPFFLITFQQGLPDKTASSRKGEPLKREVAPAEVKERQYTILQQELSMTKDYLQSIIEDKEAANEELKAAMEEIQSSNEELQSTNEELETAKEELQSTNEELTTINDELQNRNLELAQVNDDLYNVLQSANLPIVIVGTDIAIRRFTPQAEKMFNLKPTDIGRPLKEVDFGMVIPNLTDTLEDVIDQVTTREIDVKDQRNHWWSVWLRPYRTTDNKIDGAVVVFTDVDSIKKVEERLRQQTAELARMVEDRTQMLKDTTVLSAIGETAGIVGHDLRNPLQTIINTIHLAQDNNLKSDPEASNQKILKALDTIRNQAEYMDKLVSDLQDYSRELRPRIVNVNIKDLITETITNLPAPENVKISSTFDQNMPNMIRGDPNLLRRAFSNIVTNAYQAMPEGGELNIRAWMEGGKVAVSFKDTGRGMTEDVKRKIFDPLFTTKEKGVGLGLSVTKRLVESHEGAIRVESTPELGSTFTIELPVENHNNSRSYQYGNNNNLNAKKNTTLQK